MSSVEDLDATRGPTILGSSITLLILGTTGVFSRFVTRRYKRMRFGADDWLTLSAWILHAASCSLTIYGVRHGAGRHREYVLETNPSHLKSFLKFTYAFDIVYPLSACSIKASFCCLYLRLFGKLKFFRWYSYFLLSMVGVWAVTVLVISVLQCRHLKDVWNFDRQTCVNLRYSLIDASVPGPVIDFLILTAPIRPVWKLHLSTWKRLLMVFLFMLGLSEVSVSTMRLIALWTSKNSNITWNYTPYIIWTTAETSTGLFCVCCPVIGTLFPELRTQHFTSTRDADGEAQPTVRKGWIPWSVRALKPFRRRSVSSRTGEDTRDEGAEGLGHGIMRTISITIEFEDR